MDLVRQQLAVAGVEPRPGLEIGRHARTLERSGQDALVGHAGDRDVVEAPSHTEKLLERPGQRAIAGLPRQQEGAVDVEEEDGHGGTRKGEGPR